MSKSVTVNGHSYSISYSLMAQQYLNVGTNILTRKPKDIKDAEKNTKEATDIFLNNLLPKCVTPLPINGDGEKLVDEVMTYISDIADERLEKRIPLSLKTE